jgi:hypothetical protein
MSDERNVSSYFRADSNASFDESLACEVIIVKNPMDAKCSATVMLQNASHLSNALDSEFFAALIRRLKQYLNPNIGSDRGAFAAQDQCAVEGHIRGEASLGVRSAIIPMKNDRQLKSISDCGSALQSVFQNGPWPHMPLP